MTHYECYTDGAYSSARNQGGIGVIFLRNGEKVFAEAMPVDKVVDTTAAGDFYAAGVMYGLMHGYTLLQCAEIGTLLAGHVIQTVGTKLTPEVWREIKLNISRIVG